MAQRLQVLDAVVGDSRPAKAESPQLGQSGNVLQPRIPYSRVCEVEQMESAHTPEVPETVVSDPSALQRHGVELVKDLKQRYFGVPNVATVQVDTEIVILSVVAKHPAKFHDLVECRALPFLPVGAM